MVHSTLLLAWRLLVATSSGCMLLACASNAEGLGFPPSSCQVQGRGGLELLMSAWMACVRAKGPKDPCDICLISSNFLNIFNEIQCFSMDFMSWHAPLISCLRHPRFEPDERQGPWAVSQVHRLELRRNITVSALCRIHERSLQELTNILQ